MHRNCYFQASSQNVNIATRFMQRPQFSKKRATIWRSRVFFCYCTDRKCVIFLHTSIWPNDFEQRFALEWFYQDWTLSTCTRSWLITFLLLIRYVTLPYLDLRWIFRMFLPPRTHSAPANFKFQQNWAMHRWVIYDSTHYFARFSEGEIVAPFSQRWELNYTEIWENIYQNNCYNLFSVIF